MRVCKKLLALENAEDAATAAVSLLDTPNGEAHGLDLETECGELLQLVGEAGSGCRQLNTAPLVGSFLRLAELPLLQTVRARLREVLDACEWSPATFLGMCSSAHVRYVARRC